MGEWEGGIEKGMKVMIHYQSMCIFFANGLSTNISDEICTEVAMVAAMC